MSSTASSFSSSAPGAAPLILSTIGGANLSRQVLPGSLWPFALGHLEPSNVLFAFDDESEHLSQRLWQRKYSHPSPPR
jgi:hypothetical protein